MLFDRSKAHIRIPLLSFPPLLFRTLWGCFLASSLYCHLSWLFFSGFFHNYFCFLLWFFCGDSPLLMSPICWWLSFFVSIDEFRGIIQNLTRVVELKFSERCQASSSSLNEDFLSFLECDLGIMYPFFDLHQKVGEFFETDCLIDYLEHYVRFSRSASSLLTLSSFLVTSSY